MIIVVRLSALAKNVPHRNRGGFHFTHEPQAVDVSDEQLTIIKSDPYLKICNFPSIGWFDGLGIERTQKNEDKFKDKEGNYVQIKEMPKTARVAAGIGEEPKEQKQSDDKPHELTASSPKEELVKALEKRGKVASKDFDTKAKSEALFAMLKSL